MKDYPVYSEQRRAQLEEQLLQLKRELEDTTAAPARADLLKRIKTVDEELANYYYD